MFRTILVPVDLAELDVSKKAIEVAPTCPGACRYRDCKKEERQ